MTALVVGGCVLYYSKILFAPLVLLVVALLGDWRLLWSGDSSGEGWPLLSSSSSSLVVLLWEDSSPPPDSTPCHLGLRFSANGLLRGLQHSRSGPGWLWKLSPIDFFWWLPKLPIILIMIMVITINPRMVNVGSKLIPKIFCMLFVRQSNIIKF